MHRIRDLVIGERRFDHGFAIVQPEVGYFARPDAVGVLGNSVLDKIAPAFDYSGCRFAIDAGEQATPRRRPESGAWPSRKRVEALTAGTSPGSSASSGGSSRSRS